MAWVSVYSTIDGPKLRDLRKQLGCSKFEAAGILVFLWLWGLENADKYGKILHADREDISECLSGASGSHSPEEILDSLFNTGWLDEDENGNFYLHDWSEWQREWYKAKERREADKKRKSVSRKASENRSDSSEELEPTKQEEPVSESVEPEQINTENPEQQQEEKAKKRGGYSVDFEEFWKAYPRKVEKGNAYSKYKARLNDGFSPESLLMAAENYAAACRKNHTEPIYIKHPKTFLSDSMPFLDFLQHKEQPTQPNIDEGNPFSEYGGR